MRRSRCGGAACGEAAGMQSVPREGWNLTQWDRDGGGPGGSTGVDRSRRPAWSRGVIGGATVTVLDSGGALEPLTRPGPGSGPAT